MGCFEGAALAPQPGDDVATGAKLPHRAQGCSSNG